MGKLFQWRHRQLISIYKTLIIIPLSHYITFARFIHSSSEDHDPPFSPKKNKNQNQNQNQNHSELPFDFMYSYSETSSVTEPIGFREPPRFSPFLDRKWTGTRAPVQNSNHQLTQENNNNLMEEEPLTDEELHQLLLKYRNNDCSRQINLGKGGVTHNTLIEIHNHWRRAEAVRIKCLGVPTLDMDNICFHLEDKTGGKIIFRRVNILLLYRGRNYDYKNRPTIPLMLWKPLAPIYPKLVKNIADGLTFEETKEMRNRGLKSPPLMKLSRNGVYVNVVERVREAFESAEVVRLDCAHVGTNDCKKIGVKLRDLVPCAPILFKDDQIVLWKGRKES